MIDLSYRPTNASSARERKTVTDRIVHAARCCGEMFHRAFAWVALCRRRAIGRRHLAEMDARMLRDIGVSRVDASMEACKRWWQS